MLNIECFCSPECRKHIGTVWWWSSAPGGTLQGTAYTISGGPRPAPRWGGNVLWSCWRPASWKRRRKRRRDDDDGDGHNGLFKFQRETSESRKQTCARWRLSCCLATGEKEFKGKLKKKNKMERQADEGGQGLEDWRRSLPTPRLLLCRHVGEDGVPARSSCEGRLNPKQVCFFIFYLCVKVQLIESKTTKLHCEDTVAAFPGIASSEHWVPVKKQRPLTLHKILQIS